VLSKSPKVHTYDEEDFKTFYMFSRQPDVFFIDLEPALHVSTLKGSFSGVLQIHD
jgi:hypothetical protein